MIFLKKLSIALSIAACAAVAVVPTLAAAQAFQTYGQTYDTTSNSGSYNTYQGGTVNPPPPSATYPTGGFNYQTAGTNYQTAGTDYQTAGTNYQTTGSAPAQQSGPGGLINPLSQVTGICGLMKILLNVALLLGVPFAMLYIVWRGLHLVLARGNPEELKKARMKLVYTIVGILIFMGAWFFAQLLANTIAALGVPLLGDCR